MTKDNIVFIGLDTHKVEHINKRRYIKGGKVGRIAANILDRNFDPKEPNQAWVSDITYVRTHEGFFICCHSIGFILSTYRRLVNGSKY